MTIARRLILNIISHYLMSECEAGQFQCYNRRCIDGLKQCDGNRDCNEGEDEINCRKSC